jgi:hypothetical protein
MLSTDEVVAIYRMLNHVHHLIDGRRWDELDSVFAEDAIYDLSYRDLPPVVGLQAIRELMVASFERDYDHLLAHNNINFDIIEDPDGAVRVDSKLICVLQDGTAQVADLHDTLVKTAGGWRIQVRAASSRDPHAKTWTKQAQPHGAVSSA